MACLLNRYSVVRPSAVNLKSDAGTIVRTEPSRWQREQLQVTVWSRSASTWNAMAPHWQLPV